MSRLDRSEEDTNWQLVHGKPCFSANLLTSLRTSFPLTAVFKKPIEVKSWTIHEKFRAARHISYNSDVLKLMVSEKAPRLPHTGSASPCQLSLCTGLAALGRGVSTVLMVSTWLMRVYQTPSIVRAPATRAPPKRSIHPRSEQEEPGHPLTLDSPSHDQVHKA